MTSSLGRVISRGGRFDRGLRPLGATGVPRRDHGRGDGARAECVMLNKGPHVVRAARMLDDILRRMQNHQAKKSAMLRELQLAHSSSMG